MKSNLFKAFAGFAVFAFALTFSNAWALDVNTNTDTSVNAGGTGVSSGNSANINGYAPDEKSAYDNANNQGQGKWSGVGSDVNKALDTRVETAISGNTALAGTDVKAKAKSNGEITLKGKVRTEAQKIAAEQAARAVSGVRTIRNDIKVDANMKAKATI